jgi:hypothetical protein
MPLVQLLTLLPGSPPRPGHGSHPPVRRRADPSGAGGRPAAGSSTPSANRSTGTPSDAGHRGSARPTRRR